jgi:hypothetical protein
MAPSCSSHAQKGQFRARRRSRTSTPAPGITDGSLPSIPLLVVGRRRRHHRWLAAHGHFAPWVQPPYADAGVSDISWFSGTDTNTIIFGRRPRHHCRLVTLGHRSRRHTSESTPVSVTVTAGRGSRARCLPPLVDAGICDIPPLPVRHTAPCRRASMPVSMSARSSRAHFPGRALPSQSDVDAAGIIHGSLPPYVDAGVSDGCRHSGTVRVCCGLQPTPVALGRVG